MIKITKASYMGNYQVKLTFSDGLQGMFDGRKLLQRQGSLLERLKDERFFSRVYVEAGALSWPHGLELSPARLHQSCQPLAAVSQAA